MTLISSFAFIVPLLYVVGYVVYQRHFHPLSKFPGPFLASVTNWWRFYHELRGDLPLAIHWYHKRYGPFVRVAPNEVDSDAAEAVEVVYKKGGRHYVKSNFYDGFTAVEPNVFGTRDEDLHSLRRRQMAHAFSQTSLLQMEYIFDRHVIALLDTLDKRAQRGRASDLGMIFGFYSQDVNRELNLGLHSETQTEGDPSHLLPMNEHITLAKLTGFVPRWKAWFSRYGPLLPWPYLTHLLRSRAQIREEAIRVTDLEFKKLGRSDVEKDEDIEFEDEEDGRVNLLTRLARAKDPMTGELVPKVAVVSNAVGFLAAGSHSTTSTLEIFFWYLLHFPKVMRRVVEEIDKVFGAAGDNADILPFAGMEASMPYISAVWKETWRLSPTFQHPAPRMTPLPGDDRYPTVIQGTEIPPGYAISASIYSLHHNQDVWGADADDFVPTRWLDDGQARKNEGILMHLGQGHRACIGRNQAMIVLWKAAVEILRRFDIALEKEDQSSSKECRLRATGFAELKEPLDVRIARRVAI